CLSLYLILTFNSICILPKNSTKGVGTHIIRTFGELGSFYMLLSMGATTARMGLLVSRFLLNSTAKMKNASIFSSSVNEKNILLSAPPFSEGNQLEFIIKEEAFL